VRQDGTVLRSMTYGNWYDLIRLPEHPDINSRCTQG